MFIFNGETFDVKDKVRVTRVPKTKGKITEIIEGEIWEIRTTMGGYNKPNHTVVLVFGTPKHWKDRPMKNASKRKIVLGDNVSWEKSNEIE